MIHGSISVPLLFHILFVFLLWLPLPVHGWGCKGHMLVAEIAHRHLTEDNRRKVDYLVQQFHESGPFLLSPTFVEAACWSDDLKMWQQFSMSAWHYIDIPYIAEEDDDDDDGAVVDIPPGMPFWRGSPSSESEELGLQLRSDILPKMPEPHVLSAIRDMLTALKNSPNNNNNNNNNSRGKTSKSPLPLFHYQFALFHLIHFMGDVHQPLHTTDRYSKAHPKGDRGGNAFKVLYKGKEVKLHSVWDDMCDMVEPRLPKPTEKGGHRLQKHTPQRPLSEKEYTTYLRPYADALEDMYKFDKNRIKERDIHVYAEESYLFAINSTYADLIEGEEIPSGYVERCQQVSEARVTLAGRRLAFWLNEVMDNLDFDDLQSSSSSSSLWRKIAMGEHILFNGVFFYFFLSSLCCSFIVNMPSPTIKKGKLTTSITTTTTTFHSSLERVRCSSVFG